MYLKWTTLAKSQRELFRSRLWLVKIILHVEAGDCGCVRVWVRHWKRGRGIQMCSLTNFNITEIWKERRSCWQKKWASYCFIWNKRQQQFHAFLQSATICCTSDPSQITSPSMYSFGPCSVWVCWNKYSLAPRPRQWGNHLKSFKSSYFLPSPHRIQHALWPTTLWNMFLLPTKTNKS